MLNKSVLLFKTLKTVTKEQAQLESIGPWVVFIPKQMPNAVFL